MNSTGFNFALEVQSVSNALALSAEGRIVFEHFHLFVFLAGKVDLH